MNRETKKYYIKVNQDAKAFYLEENLAIDPREKLIVFSDATISIDKLLKPIDLGLRQQNFNEELIIVSPTILLGQAKRLAEHKNSIGIKSKVVAINSIFDAFGYGNKDISAIRNFCM